MMNEPKIGLETEGISLKVSKRRVAGENRTLEFMT
jgi:hypothetical protein